MSQLKEQDKMPEAFDEFDFIHRADPNIKVTLWALQKNLSAMGRVSGSTLQSWPAEYAERRSLKSEKGVVMPAYGRLLNAYKWLMVLESLEPRPSSDLPF